MNPELIARVIALVGEHNDHVVLADPQNGKTVVVMDLPAYERLLAGAASRNVVAVPSPQPPVAYQPPQYQPPVQPVIPPPQYVPPQPPVAYQPPQYQPPVQPVIPPSQYVPPQPPAAYQPPTPPPAEILRPPVQVVERRQDGIANELTQEELLEKINREIGAWKSAQERRRSDELRSGVANNGNESRAMATDNNRVAGVAARATRRPAAPAKSEPVNNEFEEERFYLEPLE